jgi:hypothetical protein
LNKIAKLIFERMDEINPDALKADGFDDCLIGICNTFKGAVFLYDETKVIEKLMRRDGMTDEEAWEFYEFNILGAYVGDYTPIYLTHAGE